MAFDSGTAAERGSTLVRTIQKAEGCASSVGGLRSGAGGVPAPRHQLGDPRRWVRLNFNEHVPDVVIRVDRMQSAGRDDRLDDGEVLGVLFGAAGEEGILSPERHDPQSTLGGIGCSRGRTLAVNESPAS
jgi:hypothetical protein